MDEEQDTKCPHPSFGLPLFAYDDELNCVFGNLDRDDEELEWPPRRCNDPLSEFFLGPRFSRLRIRGIVVCFLNEAVSMLFVLFVRLMGF